MTARFFEIQQATVWRGDTAALKEFSLEFRMGQSVAVLGPNGAGKSTLLKLLNGEVRPEAKEGTVCRLFGESHWSLEDLRHRIGVIMPEEVARFEPDELARDVVLSSMRGAFGRTREMRFSRAERARGEEAMEEVGVAHLAQRGFGLLSSGERRRFLIARALVHRPQVLVLDEPFTALDFPSSLQLSKLLRQQMESGRTLVLVTHHPGEIPPEIGRVILLKQGRLHADGRKRSVLTSDGLGALYGVQLRVRWSHGWCRVDPL